MYKKSSAQVYEELRIILGVSNEVANIGRLTPSDLVNLGGSGVRSIDGLGGLYTDELIAIIGFDILTRDAAGNIIMVARQHWFKGDSDYA